MTDQHDWLRRLHCVLHGHDLARADAYGEQLADGHIEELHYCRHCGTAVWVPGHSHHGEFPEPQTAHHFPDLVQPMPPPGSHQHIEPREASDVGIAVGSTPEKI